MKKQILVFFSGIFFFINLNCFAQGLLKQEVHIIPSAHLDRVWLQPYEVNRLRFVNMMDHMVYSMEKTPEFSYFTLDGQISLIDDYLELRPEATEIIKKLINDGRLLVGPWYTQPNVFMVSGESIIRNLYLGLMKGATFGPVMKICYLPDCFGVNSQLPQLAKGFGLNAIYFERGIPSSYFGVFNWKGSDNTECLAIAYPYMYGNDAITKPLIDNEAGRRELIAGVEKFISRDMKNKTPSSVIVNGYDMQWLIADMPEKVRIINSNSNSIHAKISHFDLLLSEVKEFHSKNKVPFKEYTGEIREHRGYPIIPASQSTRTDLKMANRRAEGIMEKYAEPLSAFLWLSGYEYPQSEINKGWLYLLNNQHHDNTAGASHDNDHRAVISAMDRVGEIGSELSRKSTSLITQRIFKGIRLNEKEFGFTVFNPIGWKRSGVEDVIIDIPVNLGINNPVIAGVDGEIEFIPDEIETTRQFNMNSYSGREMLDPIVKRYHLAIPLKDIPALGYKTFIITNRNINNKAWELHQKSLQTGPSSAENQFISLSVNYDGSLDIHDKVTGKTYPSVNYFQDDGESGSGFEHRKPMQNPIITTIGHPAHSSIIQNTPYKITYRIENELYIPTKLDNERLRRSENMTSCKIVSLVTLKKDDPGVEIRTTINNTAKDHRIRVAFPTFLNTSVSYAEQAFDVVARPVALPEDQIRNEGNYSFPVDDSHPQHSFVDLNDGKAGLMIVNKGLPLYEISNDHSKTIFIDVIRSLDNVHNGSLGETRDLLIPTAQMLGEYTFEYCIIPHSGGWESAVRDAYEFQYPLKTATPRPDNAFGIELRWLDSTKSDTLPLPQEHGFIQVENENIIVSAVKKHESENTLILRLYNPTEKLQESTITVNTLENEIDEVYEVNFLEEKLSGKYNRNNVKIKLLPRKIITLAFSLK